MEFCLVVTEGEVGAVAGRQLVDTGPLLHRRHHQVLGPLGKEPLQEPLGTGHQRLLVDMEQALPEDKATLPHRGKEEEHHWCQGMVDKIHHPQQGEHLGSQDSFL